MAFQPLMMKNVDFVLGEEDGENFKAQLRSVMLTPDTNVTKVKTLSPQGQYADVDDPEWDLELGYLYGRNVGEARAALGQFLMEHAGEKMPFSFMPWAGDATEGYQGSVTLLPGGIGGEQGSFSEQSVTLPLDGQPMPLDPVDPGV